MEAHGRKMLPLGALVVSCSLWVSMSGPASFEGDPRVRYSTYLGGDEDSSERHLGRSYSDEHILAVAANAAGDVLVGGFTETSLFPTKDAFDPTVNARPDGFAARFAPNGSLTFATYVGGNGSTKVTGTAFDAHGNSYWTGHTWATDFPVKDAWQPANGGGLDAFLLVLDPKGALKLGTFLGGSGDEGSHVRVAVDGARNVYLAGSTRSADFPVRNATQPNFGGDQDGWVAKFSPTGQLLTSTFLGGSGTDVLTDIAYNNSGSVRVTGFTYSSDFPVANAAQATLRSAPDAVVASLDLSAPAVEWSTYLGGADLDAAYGVAADGAGGTVVAGRTRSDDFPTLQALQRTRAGASDAFFAKLDAHGALQLSTYYGGSGTDQARGVALDPGRDAWVLGLTGSTDLPTRSAFQAALGGETDAFAARLTTLGPCFDLGSYFGGWAPDLFHDGTVNREGRIALAGFGHWGYPTTAGAYQVGSKGAEEGVLTVLDEAVSDLGAPCTHLEPAGTQGAQGWWTTEVTANLVPVCRCVVADSFHALDGAAFASGNKTTIAEGVHELRYYSVSTTGGQEAVRSASFKVDTTPPTVTLVNPKAGEIHAASRTLQGAAVTIAAQNVLVEANATDVLSGVARVDFYVDEAIVASDASPPYQFTWAAGRAPSGLHRLIAESWDVAGNSARAEMPVLTIQTKMDIPAPPPLPVRATGGPRIGAHVHSVWLEHDSPMDVEDLAALVQSESHGVASFAVPLGGARAEELAPVVAQRALEAFDGLPAVVQLNTFRLHEDAQTKEHLAALFRHIASALQDPDVLVVVGGNEPLSKGKEWLRPQDAADRVRMEYAAWHAASDAPFCHKFTAPKFNDGVGWDVMEQLWRDSQDALCYVWYEDTDDLATLDRLRGLSVELGKPLHILEARVPGNDPALLRAMAAQADTFVLYHLVADERMDSRFPAFVLRDGSLERTDAGAMLERALALS